MSDHTPDCARQHNPQYKYDHFTGATSYMMWLREKRIQNGPMRSFSGQLDGEEVREGERILLDGDETYVTKAQSIVDQLTLEISTPKRERTKKVYGNYPNVAAYVRGEPRNMWHTRKTNNTRTPIRLWVGLTSSAIIPNEQLIERGAALAAFAIAMANIRPVIITPFVCLSSSDRRRNMLISWDISTQPIVLSEIMSLTRPEVTRYIGIEACRHQYGQEASHDPGFHKDSWDEAKMRKHLNAKPDDLYLPPIHRDDPLLDNPIKWIQDNIAKFTTGETTDLEVRPSRY